MPTRLTLTFFGDVQLDRTLQSIERRALDARPAWERITAMFTAAERRQFGSQGLAGSAGWAPLSPPYAEWKATHYPGQPILVRTGALKRSLTDGPAVRILEPHDMWIGSDVEYGAYHQHGGPNLPKRQPVDLTEDFRREAVRELQRHIVYGDDL